jgi:hypothetical protein
MVRMLRILPASSGIGKEAPNPRVTRCCRLRPGRVFKFKFDSADSRELSRLPRIYSITAASFNTAASIPNKWVSQVLRIMIHSRPMSRCDQSGAMRFADRRSNPMDSSSGANRRAVQRVRHQVRQPSSNDSASRSGRASSRRVDASSPLRT